MPRSAGVLLHITSLPSPWGAGTLGEEAFLDTLRELAERRGKSESWGKVTFYRAKALLREKLEGWT